jgi:tetratricopeptide (TPR) repeat protein
MTTENQQKDPDSNDRSIARYSSPVFNRGLELAKKVSTATISNQDEQLFSSKSIQDAEYFFKLAVQQISPSEYQYALMNFQKALDLNPDYYEVYIIRCSLIYIPLGCYQEAINDCIQALHLHPDNPETLTNRGWSYAQLGYHLQALQDYDLALMIRPNFEIAYMNRGLSYMGCNNYQKAIDDFQQVLKINPYSADAYNNKGLILLHLKKYQDALSNLEKAIQINSEHIKAYLNTGICYFYLNNNFLVAKNFSNAIELSPEITKEYLTHWDEDADRDDNTLSYYIALTLVNLGLKFQKKSNYQEAVIYYTHAVVLNPDFEDAYHKRGAAYAQIGDIEAAISDFNRVIEFGNENPWAYLMRAKLYYELGYNYQGEKDGIIAYMLLGNQLSASGNYTEAIESYTTALKIDPNNAEAYNRRSTARSAIGDYQGAMEDLQQVRMI